MHTIKTITEASEIFIGIVNVYNQNNSEIFGLTIKFGAVANLHFLVNTCTYKFISVNRNERH